MTEGLLRRQSPVLAARILAIEGLKKTVALDDVSTDTFDILFRFPTQMTLEQALSVAIKDIWDSSLFPSKKMRLCV